MKIDSLKRTDSSKKAESVTDCFRTFLREKNPNSLNYALLLLERELTDLSGKEAVQVFSTELFFQTFLLFLFESEIRLDHGYYLNILDGILRQPNISFQTVTAFYRDMLSDGAWEKESTEEQEQDTFETLKKYIDKHLDGDLSLQHLSEYMNYNPSYLSRLFRKKNGYKLYDYIERTRLEKAKEMLAETNQPIKDIGAMVGYATPRYFSSFFKRYMQMSPSEYRQQMKSAKLK